MVRLGSCTCARRARRRKDARGIVDRCIDGKRGLDSHRPSSSSESLGKRTWCIAPEPFPSRKSNGQGEGTAQQRRESSSRKEDDEGPDRKISVGRISVFKRCQGFSIETNQRENLARGDMQNARNDRAASYSREAHLAFLAST